jgi:predicted transcriptional regulator
VRPPDAPDWERTACNWLLDQCPPDYRSYPALRHHAVILARFAILHVEANQAACRRGLSEARSGLREVADLEVIEAAIITWQAEEARLLGVRRGAGLLEEALRGRRYRARL